MDATGVCDWRIKLDPEWDVLGPFPVHAREQHFLSPAYPLDFSCPIPLTSDLTYLSSLSPSTNVSWTRTTADSNGKILVSYPHIPWEQMRATEGWAGFQHVSVLRGWLTIYPPSTPQATDTRVASGVNVDPLLRTSLVQGALFTILPPPASPERKTHIPEWHTGNVYAMARAPTQLVRLPVSPKRSEDGGTRYEVVICGAYEIRLFGDPDAYASKCPVLDISLSIQLEFPSLPLEHSSFLCYLASSRYSALLRPLSTGHELPLQHSPTHSIAPHIIGGRPFGEAIGIGLISVDFNTQGWWTVTNACLLSSFPNSSFTVTLVEPIRIAPTQMRVVPLRISLSNAERIPEGVTELTVELTSSLVASPTAISSNAGLSSHVDKFVLEVTIPLVHVPLWTQYTFTSVRATYFFAKSRVTAFTVIPPKLPFTELKLHERSKGRGRVCKGNEPVIALHGAGVDILTTSFWADSLSRQKYAWVVIPMGGTEWGLDWHGPSAADAFLSVAALSDILSAVYEWRDWGFNPDTRVVLMGHSNGGQGAWYMAARWPDRVCGVVPAAGYIKSQAYVSWSMSRFSHFIDPFLRAILETSLTPDDNDLFLSNLVGTPILAVHGGEDNNVPPWHTRELVGVLKSWDPDTDVGHHEDPGRPHWYPEVLKNDHVQAFLDKLYFSSSSEASVRAPVRNEESDNLIMTQQPHCFTLTVSVPQESGSMYGWKIHSLSIPGHLARLEVTLASGSGRSSVRTTNVSTFSLDLKTWLDACNRGNISLLETSEGEEVDEAIRWSVISVLNVDGNEITLEMEDRRYSGEGNVWFAKDGSSSEGVLTWKLSPHYQNNTIPNQPRQRLQAILSSPAPLTLLVPSLAPSPELCAALRIAYTLRLFHAIDAQVTAVHELTSLADFDEGNLVVICCARERLIQAWLEQVGSAWKFDNDAWCFGGRRFVRPSSAILFLQPHPTNAAATSLFLQYTDLDGLERAVRLFPIRTGVLSPDWIVVNGRADKFGAAGVEGAGVFKCAGAGSWTWNNRCSWLD